MLRIQDYKQWLRLKVAADGALTIYAIGIDRVTRQWRSGERGGAATSLAADSRATAPRLIDKVIVKPGKG